MSAGTSTSGSSDSRQAQGGKGRETIATLTAGELARRIIAGEREFSETRLTDGDRLEEHAEYRQLVAYLATQDLRASPLIAERAEWPGLRARGLVLGAARLAGADLSGADLREADFRRADLSGAKLTRADLSGATMIGARLMGVDLGEATMRQTDLYEASLAGANLRGVDFSGAWLLRLALKEADLTGANLTGVDFYRADLRGAIGLEAARDLGTARFHQTIVTERERAIVEAALRAQSWFDIRHEA